MSSLAGSFLSTAKLLVSLCSSSQILAGLSFQQAALVFGKADSIDETPIQLSSGESLVLEGDVLTSSLVSGTDRTALGAVSFGVMDLRGSHRGCSGLDATFDTSLRVTPAEEPKQLDSIRHAGIALMAIAFVTSFAFVSWVCFCRKTRIVKVMQPMFLSTVCFGDSDTAAQHLQSTHHKKVVTQCQSVAVGLHFQ